MKGIIAFFLSLTFLSCPEMLSSRVKTSSASGEAVNIPADKSKFHLYLLAGQSNMAGRGVVEPRDTVGNPRILCLNAEGKWVIAKEPLHWDRKNAGVGPGLSFAREMLERTSDDGVVVGLIPCAKGGSGIDVWKRGAFYEPMQCRPYDELLERTRLAMKDGELRGVLWHQGESDCTPEKAKVYKSKLLELIGDLREDFQMSGLPFVAGEIPAFHDRDRFINPVFEDVKRSAANYDVVSANGVTVLSDGIHLDAASQRTMGVRYAEKTAELQSSFGYENPVLPGFYPDPSICRVGEDYYMVTSTFAYFPGIPIFHGKDLIHWNQIGYCLTRDSQLDLKRCNIGSGLWAPTIRWRDGVFYMICTNVSGKGNFYVTATDPAGEWSDPIWIKPGGVDPSIFWDDDGAAYLTSTGGANAGIAVGKIDLKTGELLSDVVTVWYGTGGRHPEGPHLYKKDGYYYLMIAEGGSTKDGHCVTIARARNVFGPYDPCPHNPILTHYRRVSQGNPIQSLGHGEMIEAHDGSRWLTCLGIRYTGGHHTLGRETFLMPVDWPLGGWPLVNGGVPIGERMYCKTLPQHPFPKTPARDEFDSASLGFAWQYLRNPRRGDYSLTDRRGWLSLTGSELTLDEKDNPTFVGRRQQHKEFTATVRMEFSPESANETAGMCLYMSERFHYDLYLAKGNRLVLRYKLHRIEHVEREVKVKGGPILLRVSGNKDFYTFYYSDDEGKTFRELGSPDTRFLSTENASGFSGVFIALYASGNGKRSRAKAYFDRFDYEH